MPALPLIRKRSLYRWARPEPWLRNALFWGGAIAVGLAAVTFAGGSDVALAAFRWLARHSAAWPWIAPPVGLATIAYATQRWFPGTQGSGIPQTIAALGVRDAAIRDRLLSMRIAVGKLLLTLVALGTGASVGREGPTVQIGASIMHSLGRWRRFPAADLERGLILAGGAAGIAAAFNTPLAGVVFAIEELSRSFEDRSSGTIYMAVIIAGVTSVALVGNYTYFGTTSAVMADARTWLAVPIGGIAGGVCGGIFSRLMLAMRSGAGMRLASLRDRLPV
ncbi:MAG: chloride channel protein, partial [Proteobacteria bacterium]|nr:chloride channel protein [Pseudomonadota bacterium]